MANMDAAPADLNELLKTPQGLEQAKNLIKAEENKKAYEDNIRMATQSTHNAQAFATPGGPTSQQPSGQSAWMTANGANSAQLAKMKKDLQDVAVTLNNCKKFGAHTMDTLHSLYETNVKQQEAVDKALSMNKTALDFIASLEEKARAKNGTPTASQPPVTPSGKSILAHVKGHSAPHTPFF